MRREDMDRMLTFVTMLSHDEMKWEAVPPDVQDVCATIHGTLFGVV